MFSDSRLRRRRGLGRRDLLVDASRRRKMWPRIAVYLVLALLVGFTLVQPHQGGPAPVVEAPLAAPVAPAFDLHALISRAGPITPICDESGRMVQRVGEFTLHFTLDPELQERAERVLARYKVPYGVVVALEPATGRVLALAEYSAQEQNPSGLALRATYPAASLIKIITATAALESGEVTPETEIRFEGSPYKLWRRKISEKNKWRDNNISTVAEALGKSNNVVFGKLGVNVVGQRALAGVLERFGFNRPIPFDLDLQPSSAVVPEEGFELARTAAGFGEVTISPIHAALISATVANGGLMMAPYLIDSVTNGDGEVVFTNAPREVAQVASPEVIAEVADMMVKTVRGGTSSKVFHKYARNMVKKFGVAGKTGSLSGDDPPGRYEWFTGFSPLDNPRISVAGMIVNQGDLWHIKGSYAAMAVMREHFGM